MDWYSTLLTKVIELKNSGEFYYTNYSEAITNISSICSASDKPCVIATNQTLNTSGALTCDREAIIFVNGSLNISHPIRTDQSNKNGCIFIVKEDVTINPIESLGVYPDADPPKYDRFDGFVISNGQIKVAPSTLNYGIEVWGSLLAFDKTNNSFLLDRSLKNSDNAIYPTYLIHHDPRYFEIASKVLYNKEESYKSEIGDKN